jgi:surface antigen
MRGLKLTAAAGLLAALGLSSGCESMSNTAKGGLIGGGAGAGIGALAGGGKGALVGGLVGTVAGGLIGNDVDQQEKRNMQTRVAVAEARQAGPPLGITDVVQLTREGQSERVIINQIRNTGSTFQLSTEDIRMLQANNVGQYVIAEMQSRPPAVRVVRPGYYYPPPPPPPVYGGVGVIIH